MQDVIRIKSISYKRYEELLLKKERLLKEAKKYDFDYNQIFGTLNKEINSLKNECVKKRKIVSYCKSALSMGLQIKKKDLDEFVDKAMKEYEETLASLFDDDKVNIDEPVSDKDLKRVYRKLAKLIHPDMNAELKDDLIVQDLWNRACIAYNCSNMKDLQELEVLTNKYLFSITNNKLEDIEIVNIEEKIFNLYKEIEKIKNSYPYQYKYVLIDDDHITVKKDELEKELKDYKRYSEDLDGQIKEFEICIDSENNG